MSIISTCPGCGYEAADQAAPITEPPASAACYSCYTQLLARSYSQPAYRGVHQMVVDTYNAQHPGGREHRAIQAVAVCLMTLCLFLEDGVDPAEGPQLHKAMADRPMFTWLPAPNLHGLMTAADVLVATDPAGHERLVRAWAGEVWQAWAVQHDTVHGWLAAGHFR